MTFTSLSLAIIVSSAACALFYLLILYIGNNFPRANLAFSEHPYIAGVVSSVISFTMVLTIFKIIAYGDFTEAMDHLNLDHDDTFELGFDIEGDWLYTTDTEICPEVNKYVIELFTQAGREAFEEFTP